MFAQGADPAAAWSQLIIQGGAFGLLVYIVVRLAPRIIDETKKERESRDIRFEALINLMQLKFEERNAKIVQAISDQKDSWIEEIRRHTAAVIDATKSACRYNVNRHNG